MIAPAAPKATLVARLTPPGAGAIGTLAVRGPRAWHVVRELFRPAHSASRPLPKVPSIGTIWLGRLGETTTAGMADEVVVAVKRTTPGPWVEIHCHGGPEVVRFITELLEGQGLHGCSWQDLERQTTSDPLQAMAAAALAEARTVRTAAILLDQYQGAFTRAVATIRAALEGRRLAEAETRLLDLARYAGVGRHLLDPWKVVIVGAPNVGKSTLVNALAGYQRSIVSAIPGTTRDVVTTLIAIDGWPVQLADTAGLRPSPEELERLGIDRARAAAGEADLCIELIDATDPTICPGLADLSPRRVINKIDLVETSRCPAPVGAIPISARTGAGLDRLIETLVRWLVPNPPSPGAAVPFTPPLCDQVEAAQRWCAQGRYEEALSALP